MVEDNVDPFHGNHKRLQHQHYHYARMKEKEPINIFIFVANIIRNLTPILMVLYENDKMLN